MPMFQMPELWMDHWVVWQQVARKLLPASRCCLKTGCVHTVCFMRLLPQAVDPQTRPCGRQRVMRSSTHCTSCWLRTPRATLTAGSPCHSLLPTHRFSPAAGGWGAAHGIRPPDAQHGALCPQLQAASARTPAGRQPASNSPSSRIVRPLAGPSVTTTTAPSRHSNREGSSTAAKAAASCT